MVVALAATVLVGWAALRTADESSADRRAPAFSLPGVRDPTATVALSDFLGRPIVVNFWASWCVPCRKEMPALQAVSERAGGRVAFVGIDHQDGRGGATRFLDQTGVAYPSGFDPGGQVAERYRVFGMPSTFFISADGRILGEHTGELTEDELVARMARHFGLDLSRT
jgi:cytochrome c biogenesis protein CcmG/thiol:disulfide interchange protein DsbE